MLLWTCHHNVSSLIISISWQFFLCIMTLDLHCHLVNFCFFALPSLHCGQYHLPLGMRFIFTHWVWYHCTWQFSLSQHSILLPSSLPPQIQYVLVSPAGTHRGVAVWTVLRSAKMDFLVKYLAHNWGITHFEWNSLACSDFSFHHRASVTILSTNNMSATKQQNRSRPCLWCTIACVPDSNVCGSC